MSNSEIYLPGIRNNQFKMDGNGETTISYAKNWNHPIETITNKWMFEVPGKAFVRGAKWTLRLQNEREIHLKRDLNRALLFLGLYDSRHCLVFISNQTCEQNMLCCLVLLF